MSHQNGENADYFFIIADSTLIKNQSGLKAKSDGVISLKFGLYLPIVIEGVSPSPKVILVLSESILAVLF